MEKSFADILQDMDILDGPVKVDNSVITPATEFVYDEFLPDEIAQLIAGKNYSPGYRWRLVTTPFDTTLLRTKPGEDDAEIPLEEYQEHDALAYAQSIVDGNILDKKPNYDMPVITEEQVKARGNWTNMIITGLFIAIGVAIVAMLIVVHNMGGF